jgi:hypothetical protein
MLAAMYFDRVLRTCTYETNSPEGVEEISDKDRMPRATQRGSRRPNIAVLSQPNQGPVAFRLFYNRFRACQR